MVQYLELPFEILQKILSLLCPIDLVSCQLVNKHLNSIISSSLTLQYNLALSFAHADNNPCSLAPLNEKFEHIQSSERSWTSLHPNFIASLPVKHRSSGIYDLSGGTYLQGSSDRRSLQYLKLPRRLNDPLEWKKITIDKIIIDMGFCVFEHDLIALITIAPKPTQPGLSDIEMTLLEYSTGRPHPKAKESTIHVMTSDSRPMLMCETVGENLVLILNYMNDGVDERIFIWNWQMNILKVAFLSPSKSYSGILFLEEDLILLPNALTSAFDVFRIPKNPTNAMTPIYSLQLPALTDGTVVEYIACRAEPNPIPDLSRLEKKRRAQERADAGMNEVDPFAPTRGFLAGAEDAICLFRICFRNTVPGEEVHSTPKTYNLCIHRSSFLKLTQKYENTPNDGNFPLPEARANEDSSDPLRISWMDWGPPISRWIDSEVSSFRWITTSAGQRYVTLLTDNSLSGPIAVLDFNPFNVRKVKAKLDAISWEPREPLEVQSDIEVDDESWETDDETDDADDSEPDNDMDYATESDSDAPGSDSSPLSPVYTADPLHILQPGVARCRLVQAPERMDPGIFAEEVGGRLPYVEYVSKTEYEYDGVLLDEERILGITNNSDSHTSAIDIFYFG